MKKKCIILCMVLCLLMSILSGCSKTTASMDSDSNLTPVILNEVAHSVFYSPMYVAIEEGYFEDEGIDITLVTGFGADKTMTAVLTGEADIGFMGSESTIYTYAGGTEDYEIGRASCRERV